MCSCGSFGEEPAGLLNDTPNLLSKKVVSRIMMTRTTLK